MSGIRKTFMAAIAAAVVSASCHAGFVNTYTSQANFLAASGPTSFESFEGVANGTNLPLTIAGNTFSTDNTSYGSFNGINSLLSVTGSQSLRYGADSGDSLFINLNPGVYAFGIWIGDFGTTGGNPVLTFKLQDGSSVTANAGGASQFAFFGATFNMAVTDVTFTTTGGGSGDGIYFDDMYYGGNPVPEPA